VTDPAGCEPLARAARFEALRAGLPAVKYPFPRGGAEVALSEMRHAPRSRHQCRALHPEWGNARGCRRLWRPGPARGCEKLMLRWFRVHRAGARI